MRMNPNELITLTRLDDTPVYVNINHVSGFYYAKACGYTFKYKEDKK